MTHHSQPGDDRRSQCHARRRHSALRRAIIRRSAGTQLVRTGRRAEVHHPTPPSARGVENLGNGSQACDRPAAKPSGETNGATTSHRPRGPRRPAVCHRCLRPSAGLVALWRLPPDRSITRRDGGRCRDNASVEIHLRAPVTCDNRRNRVCWNARCPLRFLAWWTGRRRVRSHRLDESGVELHSTVHARGGTRLSSRAGHGRPRP